MTKKLLTFLTLLTLFFGVGWAAEVTDELNYTNVGVTGSSYTQWSGKTFNSNAVYAGQSSGNNTSIQLRATNPSGIVTTASGGKVKSITVDWKSTSARSINIYGKHSAYSSSADLYTSGSEGDFLGSIVYGQTTTFTIASDYEYIGLRSASNSLNLNSVTIVWETGGSTTETVATPTFNPSEGTYNSAQNVTISCTTSGATIYYTTDGSTPTTSSSVYSSAIPVSTTTTIKAMAAATGYNNSAVASATYTINITSTDEYKLVTDASQLSAGDQIIIASTATAGSGYAISTTQNENNRGATSVDITNSIIVPSSSVQIITLEKEGNNWLFNVGNGYLYAASSSKNYLRTETTPDANANAQATISISSNAATVTFQGTNTRNTINYNANNGNPIFSCYTSGTVYIYKKVESAPQSSDVYIVGQINGHDSDPWNTSEGVQLTYNSTNDNYAANIYCDGMKNGNDDGYSYFLFAKSLPFSWDNTSNLYGSGADNSYWPISGLPNESAFDEEIPLYEGSKNVYRLPAGLYTVTVDLDYTGHQYTTKSVKVTKRDVTLSVTNSATFETTKNVTMTSNLTDLGGKIWYTTDGSDPRTQSNQNRHEYTEQLTLDATTTIKAVAVLGCIYSDVVEKTYTKTPAAPVINPTSCTFNEPLTVTITAEEGATIYYTTDGSDPTDQSTQYTGSFTVSTTTTVKAIAYVGEAYSNIATATYTYSNVQPSTGDFVLVTSADQLVAGNEYIIINSDRTAAAASYSSSKFDVTDNFTLSNDYSTATPGNDVKIFTLEAGNESGAFYMKDDSNNYYYPLTGGTNINTGKELVYISYSDGFTYIKGSTTSTRSIAYNHQASNHVFGSYTNPTTTGNQRPVYLYTRESNSVQPPVFTPAGGLYDVPVDVTISCATTGASIYYTTDGTEPSATNGTLYDGEEFVVSETTTYKAVAVKNGNTSSVVTAKYTITPHTAIETVTLDYSEPFTSGIGKFTVQNVSGFAPVWTLDGAYGIKGTSYSANTNPTNNAAESRFLSPIIDMTDATQPELTFSHQINSFFDDVTTQATLWIRETTDGTDGNWVQLPITFSDPAAAGGWTNDVVDIDLSTYAGKKVQISFLYTNPTAGSGAGTWEIQNFMVADNSEYRLVNNIAEFLALENGTKAKFKNPVTVLYDYAQYSSNSYHEYIWVKDNSGYMQFYLIPTLNSDANSGKDGKAAYYENGDIIPAGFVVVKNYYENGKYVQAYSAEALEAGFEVATQKGLADPDLMDFDVLDELDMTNSTDVATWCNRYVTLEKIKIASKSGKNFTFADENGTVNACVGYNKYNGDGSLLKDGVTSADVDMSTLDLTKFYNVTGIIQLWQGGWEFMPIEFTEWEPTKVTLRKLCAEGNVGTEYTISNRLQCVYIREGNKLWVKDDNGQSILKKAPAEGDNNYEIGEEAGNKQLDQSLYDQSNWLEVHLANGSADAETFHRHIINGGAITGTFTNKTNPTMENVVLTSTALENSDEIGGTVEYAPNYYCAANFYNGIEGGNQACIGSQHHGDFFFMNPKPQEYAMIVWAKYDGNNTFSVPTGEGANEHGFNGEFEVNMSMNSNPNFSPTTGKAYKFEAIVRRIESTGNMLRANKSNDYIVYPLTLSDDVVTGINNVTGKAVAGVKYYNLAGMESDRPFEGVNIIVTTYTDGSRSSAKVLK